MSLAKKCNRCGKYYDHYPKGSKIQYNGVQRFFRDEYGGMTRIDEALDLCLECMDAFDKFMTSGGIFDDKT